MNAVEKVRIAITTGESATSLCLRNVTLRTVSLNSTSKSQTSAAPVLFTPSTRIVGFSGCLVQRIASEEKKNELFDVPLLPPNMKALFT